MSGSIFGPEVRDSIPDDLSCDRCGHEYASHSHETGRCHDADEVGPPGGILRTPCWCRNFEPPYPPAREEL